MAISVMLTEVKDSKSEVVYSIEVYMYICTLIVILPLNSIGHTSLSCAQAHNLFAAHHAVSWL